MGRVEGVGIRYSQDKMKHPNSLKNLRKGGFVGEENRHSKLTDQCVYKIRILLMKGFNQSVIARFFRVKPCTINNIANRKAWNHLPWPVIQHSHMTGHASIDAYSGGWSKVGEKVIRNTQQI